MVEVPDKKLVIAVSGGVDSVALLHMLANNTKDKGKLIVAHFDHGIRHDSHIDEALVRSLARDLGVAYVSSRAELGSAASEAVARQARYEFLNAVKQDFSADYIVTGHHMDDRVETLVFNLLRGTHRRGASSLRSTDNVLRPLLYVKKDDLKTYARKNNLSWREDTTNLDTKYARNRIRHTILPKLQQRDPDIYHKLAGTILYAQQLNDEIDQLLGAWVKQNAKVTKKTFTCRRHDLVVLPHIVAREVVVYALRHVGAENINRKQLELLTIKAKTAKPGTKHRVCHHIVMAVNSNGTIRFGTLK